MLPDEARLYISVITYVEFKAWPDLPAADREALDRFLAIAAVIALDLADQILIRAVVEIRLTKRIKLPDAIIAGTALARRLVLVTGDARLAGSDARRDVLTY